MDPKTYLKSVLVVVVFFGAVFMFRDQFFLPKNNAARISSTSSDSSFGWKIPHFRSQPSGQVTDIGAYSDIRDPGGVPRGLPVRLKIPTIGVDTAIEDAYITPDGRMDVPAGSINVAWFALGPHPGEIGSAVIGGHFGIDNGIPKVFYNLNKIKEGDKIYIVDDQNNTLAFIVRSIRLFGRNDDSTPVFISNDGLAHLNVITCEGIWNRVDDSYPDRRVVFTDAIPSEGAITVNTRPQPTPTIKVLKPTLPATAIIPALSVTPTLSNTPTLPATEILPTSSITSTATPLTSSQGFTDYIKSLFDTPTDGVITSLLIGSIVFIIHKIISL